MDLSDGDNDLMLMSSKSGMGLPFGSEITSPRLVVSRRPTTSNSLSGGSSMVIIVIEMTGSHKVDTFG